MKKLLNILAVVWMLLLIPLTSNAAEVSITRAQFPVVVNGRLVNNSMREYPFILYNSITYFPMTYDDCAFLGVENNWTAENGNIITKTVSSGKYSDFLNPDLALSSDNSTATIVQTPVTVLGSVVNNGAEKYPILSYKNVLYFPLTWDWSQKFGWRTTFGDNRFLEVCTEDFADSGYYYFYTGNGNKEIEKHPIAQAKESDVKNVFSRYSPNYSTSSADNFTLVFRLVEDATQKQNLLYVTEELVAGFRQNGWFTADEIANSVFEYAKNHTRYEIQSAAYRFSYAAINGRSLSDHISSASYGYTSLYSTDSRKCAVPNDSVSSYKSVGWLTGEEYFDFFINNCIKKGDYISALEFIEYNSTDEHTILLGNKYIYVDEVDYDAREQKYDAVGKAYLSKMKSSIQFRKCYQNKEGTAVYAVFDCSIPARNSIESFHISYDIIDASGRIINSCSEDFPAYVYSNADAKAHRTATLNLYSWNYPNIAGIKNVRISNVKFIDADMLPGGQG